MVPRRQSQFFQRALFARRIGAASRIILAIVTSSKIELLVGPIRIHSENVHRLGISVHGYG